MCFCLFTFNIQHILTEVTCISSLHRISRKKANLQEDLQNTVSAVVLFDFVAETNSTLSLNINTATVESDKYCNFARWTDVSDC